MENFQSKTFHKMAFTRTEENNRTNAVQSFKIDEMGFIPTPPKNLRDMENSKPNKKPFIAVMIKNWEEYKKEKKKKRVCILKPTFFRHTKSERCWEKLRKWGNNERCFERVAKTERRNKASRGRATYYKCLWLQSIIPHSVLFCREETQNNVIKFENLGTLVRMS